MKALGLARGHRHLCLSVVGAGLLIGLIASVGESAPPVAPAVRESEAVAAKTQKYEILLSYFSLGERVEDQARHRVRSLSRNEVFELIRTAEAWNSSESNEATRRTDVIFAFHALRRRADFDRAMATAMFKVLDQHPADVTNIEDLRLRVFVEFKSGRFNSKRIESMFLKFKDIDTASATRLALLGALTDAMTLEKMRPTVAQLEGLLASDVFEIRMHAVDWFNLSAPASNSARVRFLTLALSSKPKQVRERVYRTIASWSVAERGKAPSIVELARARCREEADAGSVRDFCKSLNSKPVAP